MEISPEYSLEGLIVKLQYFGHLMQKSDSLGKTLMLAKIEGRRRGQQRMQWLDGITDSLERASSGRWWRTGSLACCSPCGRRVEHDWATEQQQNLLKILNIYQNTNVTDCDKMPICHMDKFHFALPSVFLGMYTYTEYIHFHATYGQISIAQYYDALLPIDLSHILEYQSFSPICINHSCLSFN